MHNTGKYKPQNSAVSIFPLWKTSQQTSQMWLEVWPYLEAEWRVGWEGEAASGMKGEASLLFCGGSQTTGQLFSSPATAGDDVIMGISLISPLKVMTVDYYWLSRWRLGWSSCPNSFPLHTQEWEILAMSMIKIVSSMTLLSDKCM